MNEPYAPWLDERASRHGVRARAVAVIANHVRVHADLCGCGVRGSYGHHLADELSDLELLAVDGPRGTL